MFALQSTTADVVSYHMEMTERDKPSGRRVKQLTWQEMLVSAKELEIAYASEIYTGELQQWQYLLLANYFG